VCNHNPETVVFAHLPGGGMGRKMADIHGAYACSACHALVDNPTHKDWPADILKLFHHDGMVRTQEIMLNEGLIKL